MVTAPVREFLRFRKLSEKHWDLQNSSGEIEG
jgi:hypothetical protein